MVDRAPILEAHPRVPFQQTAYIVAAVFLVLFAIPMVLLPVLDAPYALSSRVSHLLMVLLSLSCLLGLRRGKISASAALALVTLGAALSNCVLLHDVGGAVNIIPSLLLLLGALIVPLPGMLAFAVISAMAGNIALAEFRYDFGISTSTMALTTLGVSCMVVITYMVRRQRESYYLQLRAEALHWAEEVERSAAQAQRLQERIAQDEKLRSLGSLAGGVVHDINNLLVPIVGNTDLLLADGANRTDRRALEEIQSAALQASQLTEQLNDFAGGTTAPPETLDLGAQVRRISDLVWRGLSESISLVLDLPDTPMYVRANRSELHQILANLLSNAVEAVSNDSARASQIALSAQVDGERARLEVRDNGSGIAEHIRPHLFEPFQTTKGKGRGMGLAAVHGALRRSGGTIEASSSSEGTTMTVTLPLARRLERQPELPSEADLTRLSVLLVDDEPMVVNALRSLLARMVHDVSHATSGEEALELLADGMRPDAILLDVRMPGMGGVETLRRIRSQYGNIPVVVSTGYAQDPGATITTDHYSTLLKKPYTRAKLGQALSLVLRKRNDSEVGATGS